MKHLVLAFSIFVFYKPFLMAKDLKGTVTKVSNIESSGLRIVVLNKQGAKTPSYNFQLQKEGHAKIKEDFLSLRFTESPQFKTELERIAGEANTMLESAQAAGLRVKADFSKLNKLNNYKNPKDRRYLDDMDMAKKQLASIQYGALLELWNSEFSSNMEGALADFIVHYKNDTLEEKFPGKNLYTFGHIHRVYKEELNVDVSYQKFQQYMEVWNYLLEIKNGAEIKLKHKNEALSALEKRFDMTVEIYGSEAKKFSQHFFYQNLLIDQLKSIKGEDIIKITGEKNSNVVVDSELPKDTSSSAKNHGDKQASSKVSEDN